MRGGDNSKSARLPFTLLSHATRKESFSLGGIHGLELQSRAPPSRTDGQFPHGPSPRIGAHRSWARGSTHQTSTLPALSSAPGGASCLTGWGWGTRAPGLQQLAPGAGFSRGSGQALGVQGAWLYPSRNHATRLVGVHKGMETRVCTAALLTTGKDWKQPPREHVTATTERYAAV